MQPSGSLGNNNSLESALTLVSESKSKSLVEYTGVFLPFLFVEENINNLGTEMYGDCEINFDGDTAAGAGRATARIVLRIVIVCQTLETPFP
jgi:hypothetical protein